MEYNKKKEISFCSQTRVKAYSLDLRQKIVTAHLGEKMSIRQVATRFSVTKSLVQKLIKQQRAVSSFYLIKPHLAKHLVNEMSDRR